MFDLVRVVHVQGYRMAFEIWKSVQWFGRSQGGPFGPPPPPPPAGRVTNQTPAGRGLTYVKANGLAKMMGEYSFFWLL